MKRKRKTVMQRKLEQKKKNYKKKKLRNPESGQQLLQMKRWRKLRQSYKK